MRFFTFAYIALIFPIFLLAGCRQESAAVIDSSKQVQLKVSRNASIVGAAGEVGILVNGQELGVLAAGDSKTFGFTPESSGENVIRAKLKAGKFGSDVNSNTIKFTAYPGGIVTARASMETWTWNQELGLKIDIEREGIKPAPAPAPAPLVAKSEIVPAPLTTIPPRESLPTEIKQANSWETATSLGTVVSAAAALLSVLVAWIAHKSGQTKKLQNKSARS